MSTAGRPEVHLVDSISEPGVALLAERCTVIAADDPAIADWPARADAIITRTTPVTAGQIARAEKIRVIAKHGVGVDHIDLDAARARGIPVINTPGTNAQSVAELTCMLTIAAARNATRAEQALRQGTAGDTFTWRGVEIASRRVGIVGLGHVGRKVAPIFANGFGCPVAAYDPYIENDPFERLGVERAASLEALLARSDILLVHTPLNDETRGMIGAAAIARLPDSAIVVNAARGGIVEEAALAEALVAGKLRAAAADVFVAEPPPVDHPLLALPNFVATPHIAAATWDAADRSGAAVARAVLDVLEGREPPSRMA